MKHILFCYSFLFCLTLNAQEKSIVPSVAHVQTTYHNELFYSMKESATIIYDETTQAFLVKIDFGKLKTGVDSLDEWLLDLEESQLVYKAALTPEAFPTPGNLVSKSIKLPGTISFNNQSHNVDLNLLIFEVNEQGIMYRDYGNNQYDKFRFRFSINIAPKDYKLDKKKHHLKKTITVMVSNGVINLIKH
ncbi:MAG: hypothetical protein Q8M29_08350 [Bacteroidota bacterium]|nr:hypothetical protein [Bacteroidota bacterium]